MTALGALLAEIAPAAPEAASLRRDAEVSRTLSTVPGDGAGIDDGPPGGLGFVMDARRLAEAEALPGLAALVVPGALVDAVPARLGVVVSDDPEMTFWTLHNRLAEGHGMGPPLEPGIDADAEIDPGARVEAGCRIEAGVEVGFGAVIRRGAWLRAGVVVQEHAIVGHGAFFTRRRPGRRLRVTHAGGVEIGEDAEIGAGAVVVRAVHPTTTRVGARTLLGTRIIVSHGCDIGEDVSIGGGAVVCGYARVGPGAWIGPGATIGDRLSIGAGARVAIGATLVRSIPDGAAYSGLFARPHAVMRDMSRALRDLTPETPGD